MSNVATRSKSHRRRTWPPAAGTVLAYDTFTGDDGTGLDQHTPDTDLQGNGWTEEKSPQYNLQSIWVLATNQAKQTEGNVDVFTATIDVNAADVQVEDTHTTSSDANCDPRTVVRFSDRLNFWSVKDKPSEDVLYLQEVNNGVWTTRASKSLATAVSTSYAYKVVCNGATITVYRDSTLHLTYSSATHNQTATKHGISTYRARNDTHDNFRVTSV